MNNKLKIQLRNMIEEMLDSGCSKLDIYEVINECVAESTKYKLCPNGNALLVDTDNGGHC